MSVIQQLSIINSRAQCCLLVAYKHAPTRKRVGVKVQVSEGEGLANLAERLRDGAVEAAILKLKILQASEPRADAVRDGTWY